MSANHSHLRRNSSRAKAYAVSEQATTLPITDSAAITNEFQKNRVKLVRSAYQPWR